MPEKQVEEVEFYYQHQAAAYRNDPAKGANGVYSDDVARRKAEVERARIEGREPDLENPPAVAGTPLVRREQLNADHLTRGAEPAQVLPVVTGFKKGSAKKQTAKKQTAKK